MITRSRSQAVSGLAGAASCVMAAALILTPAAALRAQGTVSGQGFGYPPGQLSTRALGTAGSIGEFDPVSPLNPAALAASGRTLFSVQSDPEYRKVSIGGLSSSTNVVRFPLVAAALRVSSRAYVGIAASTFLDRTWQTESQSTTTIGGEQIATRDHFESSGSIADVRLGGAWLFSPRLRVGLAGHVYTGENRLVTARTFGDTLRFGPLSDSSSLGYRGIAASAGVEWTPMKGFAVAGSMRQGGTMKTVRGDTTITTARVPNRYGAGIRFDAIPGSIFAAGVEYIGWSKMRPLGTAELSTFNALDYSAGAEVGGPKLGGRPMPIRVGLRHRTLPFGVNGNEVKETSFSGGFGLVLARGLAGMDFAAQHANRTGGPAKEAAWTFSVGLSVRP